MATVVWEPIQPKYCERVDHWVTLEVLRAYPAEFLPDHPPRLLSHRCPEASLCNQLEKPACAWAGTQPDYDPLH